MSALRDEIRAILREEIAALRSETQAQPPGPVSEQVRITSSTELTRFAKELIERASEPGFVARVARGALVFELAGAPSVPARAIVTGPARKAPDRLEKRLITERDINALDSSARRLCVGPDSRVTPLARDEARRRGIRIERVKP